MDFTEASGLRRIESIFNLFRDMDENMAIVQVYIFSYIALSPGISISEIAKDLNVTQATVSRSVGILSDGYKEHPGHGVVEKTVDSKSHRRKVLHLTTKGEELVNQIELRCMGA